MMDYKFIYFFSLTQIFLLSNDPYDIGKFLPLPNLYVSAALYLVLLVFGFVLGKKNFSNPLPSSVIVPFLFTALGWFIFGVYHNDASYFTRIVFLIITFLFLSVAYENNYFEQFWKYNNRFILVQAILSTICFVLVSVGILKPLAIFTAMDDTKLRCTYFWGGCFSKTYIGNMIRPCGYFDEPGALAAWAMYGLMFNFAFIKDKYITKLLPWFTASTLSVAFFIQMGFFLIVRYIKKIYKLVPIALLLFLSIHYINLTKDTDFDIYSKTIARFELDEDSGIAGNSRQIAMDNSKQIFDENPWFGMGGQNYGALDIKASDNPYEVLAKDGIIGFVITYIPLLIIAFVNRRKMIWICILIISVGYLQRPFHINFIHDLYLWSFLLFCIIDKKQSFLNNSST